MLCQLFGLSNPKQYYMFFVFSIVLLGSKTIFDVFEFIVSFFFSRSYIIF